MSEQKELSVIKGQVSKLENQVNELVVDSPETYSQAVDLVSKLKDTGSKIKDQKESITKPLNEALRNARGMFAPIEDSFEKAEALIKRKLLDYKRKVDEEARKKEEAIAQKLADEKAKLDAQVKAGEITEEKADEKFGKKLEKSEDKLDSIDRVENTTHGETGKVSIRKVKKVRIVDADLVPRAYLVVDEVKVRKDALAGLIIAGVEVYEEEQIAAGRY